MDPATATLVSGLLSSAPGLIQTLFGGEQSRRAKEFGAGLTRPVRPIPQESTDALETVRTLASGLQMPGYENAMNEILNIMAGATGQIGSAATTSSQALGALTQASGQQMKAVNQLAADSAVDYRERQRMLAEALRSMGIMVDEQWMFNEFGDYQERANASAALGGAGIQNKYGGLSDLFGSLASMLPMLAKSGAAGTETPGGGNTGGQVDLLKAMIQGMAPKNDTVTPEQILTPQNQPGAVKANRQPMIGPGGMDNMAMFDTPLYTPFGAGLQSENSSMFNLDQSALDEIYDRLGIEKGGFYNPSFQ